MLFLSTYHNVFWQTLCTFSLAVFFFSLNNIRGFSQCDICQVSIVVNNEILAWLKTLLKCQSILVPKTPKNTWHRMWAVSSQVSTEQLSSGRREMHDARVVPNGVELQQKIHFCIGSAPYSWLAAPIYRMQHD